MDDDIAELERENNMLRARHERQEKEIKWLETLVNNLQLQLLNLKNEKEIK